MVAWLLNLGFGGTIISAGAEGTYHVYSRLFPGAVDVPVASVAHPTTQVQLTGLAVGSEQWYQVRAETPCGVEDVEPLRLVRVAFDGAGNLILPVPNAPTGLRLTRGASGAVAAIWNYLSHGQADAPSVFNVYVAENDAAFDFGTPLGQVSYIAGRRRFECDLGAFADRTLVHAIVRAAASSGAEETNLNAVSTTADSLAPDPAISISVEVVAS